MKWMHTSIATKEILMDLKAVQNHRVSFGWDFKVGVTRVEVKNIILKYK